MRLVYGNAANASPPLDASVLIRINDTENKNLFSHFDPSTHHNTFHRQLRSEPHTTQPSDSDTACAGVTIADPNIDIGTFPPNPVGDQSTYGFACGRPISA